MKRILGFFAVAVLLAGSACSLAADPIGSGEAGAGGSGGSGGTGGDAGAAPHCDSLCASLSGCAPDVAPIDEAECAEDCRTRRLSADLVEPCAACLEAVECSVADVACRWGPACRMAWDVEFRAEGLDAFEGRTLRVMVVEAIDGEVWVDVARDAVVEDGAVRLSLEGALTTGWDIPFDVVVIADGDGDGACIPGGADRAWRIPLGIPQGHAQVMVDAATAPVAVDCRFWDTAPEQIVLVGAGLDEMEGKYVVGASAWIGADFTTLTRYVTAQIRGGTFRMRFGGFGDVGEGQRETTEFRAVWMIDLDGDWACSTLDAGGSELLPPLRGLEQRVRAGPSAPGTAPCELLRGL